MERSAASCISALWSVPTGDQCPCPSRAHGLQDLVSPCTLMNRRSEEAVGPGKGSPIAWLSRSIFSLILNKSFIVVCLIDCFKLTTWKKSLGYLWFSCSVPVPSPLGWGDSLFCNLCKEFWWPRWEGGGSLQKDHRILITVVWFWTTS